MGNEKEDNDDEEEGDESPEVEADEEKQRRVGLVRKEWVTKKQNRNITN